MEKKNIVPPKLPTMHHKETFKLLQFTLAFDRL